MAWNDITAITDLSVALETGSQEATIYGNGRNQIGVIVYLKGVDKNGKAVSITPEEILSDSNTQLIDYVTGEKLNWKKDEGWNYTHINNGYHTIPGLAMEQFDANPAIAKYYVQCATSENIRTKSIAVKANLSNRMTYSTASKSGGGSNGLDSKVKIMAIESKIYTISDMNLHSEDTSNGDLKVGYKKWSFAENKWESKIRDVKWDQDNYYFFINEDKHPGFYVKCADISHYKSSDNGKFSKRWIYNGCVGANLYVAYIWEMGDDKETKDIKIYASRSKLEGSMDVEDISTNITINQRRRAICLTRMLYQDTNTTEKSFWSDVAIKQPPLNSYFDCTINVYDQYGNMGKFHTTPNYSDINRIRILDYGLYSMPLP